jgi:hypothetical protein
MQEVEKQEGQKTVVAFITGLLIGGLLVWVFSSTPTTQAPESTESDTTEEINSSTEGETEDTKEEPKAEMSAPQSGAGDLGVQDQSAGNSVALGKIEFKGTTGWIVVRDYANGVPGKILGAARYNLEDGLVPTEVPLLRSTVKGSTYQVQFYSENGDRKFDTTTDKKIEGGEAVFTAQ